MSHPHRSRSLRPLATRIGISGTLVAAAGFVACSSGAQGPQVSSSSNPAAVTIDVRDVGDHHIGSCTGTLLSPGVVLTAGHCVVASGGTVVTTADGQTAFGRQFWTTWDNFQSSWSHPLHSDVAVLLLDRSLSVSSYPSLASSVAVDGQTLSRVRRVDATAVTPGNYEQVTAPVHLGAAVGFPLAYTMDAAAFEGPTDTGGALLDPASGTVHGVVSSRGLTSGEVYISRVEYLADWIASIASCTPLPFTAQCHPKPPGGSGSGGEGSSGSGSGGQSSSGSSSGGSWGGSSGGSGSGSGGGSSSGSGSGGSSGGGGGCNPPPPPPPSTGGEDGGSGSSSGGTASSSSGSSSSGGRTPYPGPGIPLIPDGPGCTDSTCGGCADDPSCSDGQQDYGDCGCEPPPAPEAGPIQ